MNPEHPFVKEAKQTIKADNIQVILLDDMLRLQHEMYKLEKLKKPKGEFVFYTLNLTADSVVTRVDFMKGNNDNIPDNTAVRKLPGVALHSLTVRNDGQGDVVFSINQHKRNFEAEVLLKRGETENIKPGYAIICNINIQAIGANSTVRLIGLV